MNEADKKALADKIEQLLIDLEPKDYHEILKMVGWRNPWRPTRRGCVNVLDQMLHMFYAVLIYAPLLIYPSPFTAAASGFILGGIREYEQWKKYDYKILMLYDRLQDAFFFGVGAMFLYAIVKAV